MAQIYGDRWEITKSIGEGGQAHIFIAKDIKGDGQTQYVLKRLKNAQRLDRFKKEIEAVRNLSHPNIVRLIDFDIDSAKPYLITEYCSAGSLEAADPFWIKSPIDALELFLQICEGVGYAHTNNIIHRDIKPSNIYLRSATGPAVLGDFGVCYIDKNGERYTLTDEAVGSFNFMAPEFEAGRLGEISKKCDVYSLGKVLYWLLSGGKILPREKFRDENYDLKGKSLLPYIRWNNIYMEHINRILDVMLIDDPEKRRNVENITIQVRKAIRLIRKEFTPIRKGIPQPCLYCGCGIYQEIQLSTLYSGLNIANPGKWRIQACDTCGHTQLFHIDGISQADWWL